MPEMNDLSPSPLGLTSPQQPSRSVCANISLRFPPISRKASIKAGVNLRTEAELRQFAENLMGYSAH